MSFVFLWPRANSIWAKGSESKIWVMKESIKPKLKAWTKQHRFFNLASWHIYLTKLNKLSNMILGQLDHNHTLWVIGQNAIPLFFHRPLICSHQIISQDIVATQLFILTLFICMVRLWGNSTVQGIELWEVFLYWGHLELYSNS